MCSKKLPLLCGLFIAFVIAAVAGCVDAKLNVQQVVVQHSFTAPYDIPGCSPSLEVPFPCPTAPVTVNLPPITQSIHFSPPAGVVASAYVDEIDISTTSGVSLDFIQSLTVELSGPNIATYLLVDYQPSVPPTTELQLFPDDQNILPYIEGDQTTFGISIYGTVPTAEVPLDVTIFLNGNVEYKKGL
jgi:hypothetical protein